MHPKTIAVHQGVYADTSYNSVTTPIYPSSTFYFDRLGEHRGFDYTRTGNPTRRALQQNLAALEGGVDAEITCTGMAAIATALFLFKAGDHIITADDIYGGTHRLFADLMPNMGLQFSYVDMTDPQQVRDALRPETRCIWIETPSNPMMKLTDIAAMVDIARSTGRGDLLTICDNTFLSPLLQRPFELGVDVVLHSTTKYINGHSDVVGGAVISRTPELAERIKFIANGLGTVCSPFDAFLVLRGVKTMPQRMAEHEKNAAALAAFLADHSRVKQVYYPGLPDHPQHDLARRQQSGFGGMLSFDIDAPEDQLDAFFGALQLFRLAESLGGVESLIEQPWSMSHASMAEPARRSAGISPQTIRVSTGIEHHEDLIEDLSRGFEALGG